MSIAYINFLIYSYICNSYNIYYVKYLIYNNNSKLMEYYYFLLYFSILLQKNYINN